MSNSWISVPLKRLAVGMCGMSDSLDPVNEIISHYPFEMSQTNYQSSSLRHRAPILRGRIAAESLPFGRGSDALYKIQEKRSRDVLGPQKAPRAYNMEVVRWTTDHAGQTEASTGRGRCTQ